MKDTIHYYIYKDYKFMKELYTQVFDELPDIGAIEYIGSKSKNDVLKYSMEGIRENGKNINDQKEREDINLNKNIRDLSKGEVSFSQSLGEDIIRFYSNIDDIKSIVNNGMYINLVEKIVNSKCSKYNKFKLIKGKLFLYDGFENSEDIFLKIKEDCIWLKKSLLDTNIETLVNILQDVNVLGYVLSDKTGSSPRIIKAIAIYD